MKIYTKKGDKGCTSLYDGTKVNKNNIVIDCVGSLDEFNCEIGNLIYHINNDTLDINKDFINIIIELQSIIFDLGSLIANPKGYSKSSFDNDLIFTKRLEYAIDDMTIITPKLTNFILPGGNAIMISSHKARTICRNVERKIVDLKLHNNDFTNENCLICINRLSDFFFAFSRYIGFIAHIPETIYNKSR